MTFEIGMATMCVTGESHQVERVLIQFYIIKIHRTRVYIAACFAVGVNGHYSSYSFTEDVVLLYVSDKCIYSGISKIIVLICSLFCQSNTI